MRRLNLLYGNLALFLFVFSGALPYADIIYLQDSDKPKVENVTVVEDTYRKVVYKDKRGRSFPLEPERVKWIHYSNASPDFLDGMRQLEQENYSDALYFFQRALNKDSTGWAGTYHNFYLGRTYHLSAERGAFDKTKYEQAIQFYKKAVEAKSDTRYLRECHFYTAQCYLSLKEYNRAMESLNLLQSSLSSDPKTSKWAYRASLCQGRIAFEQKHYDNAITCYRQARDLGDEREKAEAQLNIAKCLIEQKNFADALKEFDQIQGDSKIEAAVKNGIASCYLAQGNYRKARRTALDVIFSCQKVEEALPEAYFLVGTCYEKLKDEEPGSLQRAILYYKLVRTGYPATSWAREAGSRLNQLERRK